MDRMFLRRIALFSWLTLTSAAWSAAQTANGGLWNDTGTWQGGNIPTASSSVIINSNVIVTISAGTTAVCKSLQLTSGTLIIQSNGTLTVGDTWNKTGGTFTADSASTVTIGGSSVTNLAFTHNSGKFGTLNIEGAMSGGITLPGLEAAGAVTVKNNSGGITQNGAINTPALTLTATGTGSGITQATGAGITGGAVTVSAPGSIAMNGTNTETSLTVTAAASVSWRNTESSGLTVTLPASGLSSVSITETSGKLTLTNTALTTSGNITLAAVGNIEVASDKTITSGGILTITGRLNPGTASTSLTLAGSPVNVNTSMAGLFGAFTLTTSGSTASSLPETVSAQTITINGPAKAAGAALALRTNALTFGSGGSINASNGKVSLYPATSSAVSFGGTSAGGVHYNSTMPNFTNIGSLDIGDTTNTSNITITNAAATSASAFTYPLTLTTVSAGTITFSSSFYTSKTLDFSADTSGKVTFSSSPATLSTGAATLTFNRPVDIGTAAVTIIAGALTFDNTITGSGTAPLTLTNSGTLTFGAGARAAIGGAFTQNGTGSVVINGADAGSTPFMSATGGITVTRAITGSSAGITFKVGASATAYFAENVTFTGPFQFLGGNLITQQLAISNMLKVTNSGLWCSGFKQSGSVNASAISAASIIQDGAGACLLTGDLTSNSNIAFSGPVDIWTGQLTIQNTGAGPGGAGDITFTNGFRKASTVTSPFSLTPGTYAANVSIITGTNTSYGQNVTIGPVGASGSGNSVGKIDITHYGLLTLKGDVYAARLYQQPEGKAVTLNLTTIVTNGDGSKPLGTPPENREGGIIFRGNIRLDTTDTGKTITFNTKPGGAPIYVKGTTKGNNNLILNAGATTVSTIIFEGALGGSPADSDADKIGKGSGWAIDVSVDCAFGLYPTSSENTNLSFGAIRAKNPLKIQPITTTPPALPQFICKINGDIFIDAETPAAPSNNTSLFGVYLHLNGCYAINSKGNLDFEGSIFYGYGGTRFGRLVVTAADKITLKGAVTCDTCQLDLITNPAGTIEMANGFGSIGSAAYAALTDVLYINTGTLILDNSNAGFNIQTNQGNHRIVRLIIGKEISYTNDPTPDGRYAFFSAGGGQGHIILQPQTPGQDIYIVANAATVPAGAVKISSWMLEGCCSGHFYIGSLKQNVSGITATEATHYYPGGDSTNFLNTMEAASVRDGTGSIYIGTGITKPILAGATAMPGGSWGYDLHIQRAASSAGTIAFQFPTGSGDTGSLQLIPGHKLFINAENTNITSTRNMDAVTPDLHVSDTYGTLFINVNKIGTGFSNALILQAQNLGEAGKTAVAVKDSAYIKNLYERTAAIWSIQADAAGGVIAYRSKGSVEIPQGAGGLTASVLHIKSEDGGIQLSRLVNTAKTAVLLAAGEVSFSNRNAAGLTVTAETTTGRITITEQAGDITLKATPQTGSHTDNKDHYGVISAGGTVQVQPKTGGALLADAGITKTGAGYPGNAGPVHVRTDGVADGGAGPPGAGAPIQLSGPLYAQSANMYSVLVSAGTSTIALGGGVAGVTAAQAPAGESLATYLYSFEVESGTLTKYTRSDLRVVARHIRLGSTARMVTIRTQGDANEHITLRTDELLSDHQDSVINAGAGNFQIYPITDTAGIEYAPPPSANNPPYTVFYSSEWQKVTAGSFTIGGDTHKGDILLRNVQNTPIALTVKQQAASATGITIDTAYTSANKPLTLKNGTKGVLLNAPAAPNNVTIDLGSAALELTSLTLQQVNAASLRASGGITINGAITVDTIKTGSKHITMTAGTSNITMGAAGTSAARTGSLSVTAAKDLTLNGSVYASGGIQFDNTSVTVAAPLTLSSSTANSITLAHNTTLTLGADLTLDASAISLNPGTNSTLTLLAKGAAREVSVKAAAAVAGGTGNWLVFTGAGFTVKDANTASARLSVPNVRINLDDNAKSVQLAGFGIQQTQMRLDILKGRLETAAGSDWTIGSPSGNKGFNVVDTAARVTMETDTVLATKGDVRMASGAAFTADPGALVLFNGSGAQTLDVSQKMPSVGIAGSAILSLGQNLTVTGDWTQRPAVAAFAHGNKGVTFEGAREHRVNCHGAGTAAAPVGVTWYDFTAVTPGMTLLFDTYAPTGTAYTSITHTVMNKMTIKGSAAAPVTLSRLPEGAASVPDARPSVPDTYGFWFLDPPAAPGTVEVAYLEVYYSFVKSTNPIEPPATVKFAPYSAYHSVNWLRRNIFIYTWTEDSDGNGQIDRLRVQLPGAYPLRGDITRFKPVVEGYTVKNCEFVPGHGPADFNPSTPNHYMIYINLEESGQPDTDAKPRWNVGANCPLEVEESASVWNTVDTYDEMLTLDTAPPRVAYALAIAGHKELYVRMSEPVAVSGTVTGTFAGRTLSGRLAPGSERELLFTLDAAFSAGELIEAAAYADSVFAGVRDRAADVLPQDPFHGKDPVEPLYPDRYAADYSHGGPLSFVPFSSIATGKPNEKFSLDSAAASVTITQPNTFSSKTGDTRATDALILRPVSPRDIEGFTFWPVYAKDSSGRSHEREDGGIGTAVRYDGGEKLRSSGGFSLSAQSEDAVVIEAAGAGLLDRAPLTPEIVYAFEVNASFRQRLDGEAAALGVWLPSSAAAGERALNMVPKLLDTIVPRRPSSGNASANYRYKIPDADIQAHDTMEFIFKMGALYGFRLDSSGGAIPADWYRRLRTFGVGFQQLRRQRGSVTIMRNVINPERGEIAALNYTLARSGPVTIQVFSLDGSLIRELKRGSQSAGDYTVSWDGRNTGGRPVARGMYVIRAVAPDIDEIRKVMIVK